MLETLLACDAFDLSSIEIDNEMIPIVAMVGGFFIAMFAIAAGTAKSIASGRAREASRREIAAYIAEGTMTADEGERILNAGRPHWERWHC